MPRPPNTSPQTRLILEALLKQPRSAQYGYELTKATGLKSGTVYPVLMRLKELGWLDAQWQEPEVPGRPPRQSYRLTPVGRRAAIELLSVATAPKTLTPRMAE